MKETSRHTETIRAKPTALDLVVRSLRSGGRLGLNAVAAAAMLAAIGSPLHAAPMNPAFTYQGRLYDNGSAVSGTYNMRFTLLSGPNQMVTGCENPLLSPNVSIANGVFSVSLQFCAEAFDGSDRWLQIEVLQPNGNGASLFSTSQKITATPYAIHADTARFANTATLAETANSADVATRALSLDAAVRVPWSSISDPPVLGGAYSPGEGLALSGNTFRLDTSSLDGSRYDGRFWKLGGNLTTGPNLIGTVAGNIQPLDFIANNQRILRLEPTVASPNLIGGNARNAITVGVSGGTIGGGGYYFSSPGTIFFPAGFTDDQKNAVTDDYSTVGGGSQNRAGNNSGTTSDASYATVGGGHVNTAAGQASTVSGGDNNNAGGRYAAIPGGSANSASGNYSLAAGHRAKATHTGSFVWADTTEADYSSTANDQFSVRASGGIRLAGDTSLDGNILLANDHDLYLHGSSSFGLGYRSTVGTETINGPFLYGFEGGALGGSAPETVALTWTWGGDVSVTHNLSVANDVTVSHSLSTATLTIRGGADLAEPFRMSGKDIPQGGVVVIDEENPGQLKMSSRAYDRQVAGIVSGANGINPGISLHQDGALEGGQNVALTGRVYVQADASFGEISPGDLLTTSDTPGHAMKVADHAKAQGAILGKAMSALKKGKGLVLVLVSLQ